MTQDILNQLKLYQLLKMSISVLSLNVSKYLNGLKINFVNQKHKQNPFHSFKKRALL